MHRLRSMDGVLLEGQERSGSCCVPSLFLAQRHHVLQLFARRGSIPPPSGSDADPWTSFTMPLREPTPIPSAFDFTRFLASSITFMSHLSQVSVYFDDKRLSRLTKSSGMETALTIPRGLSGKSPLGIMNVTGIKSTRMSFFSSFHT
jgi:hypothetical protein